MTSSTLLTYVASSKTGHDTGAYVLETDLTSGAFRQVDTITAIAPGQYLAFDRQKRFFYLTGASGGDVESTQGRVGAFTLDGRTGRTTFLNARLTGGNSPCYVTADGSGRLVLGVNYSGQNRSGSVWAFPAGEDGRLGEATTWLEYEGGSINPDRQAESHPHMIEVDPDSRFAYANDLGTDKILIYDLDLTAGRLSPHAPPSVPIAPGAGPRHLDFSERQVYLITELANTLVVFDHDRQRGILTQRQTVSTLPDNFRGESYAADVHVAPSGRFVYGSNRGHNSIAIFAIDGQTGEVTTVGHQPVLGDWPRSFAIDPSGKLLIVANQRSSSVVSFWIDETTGRLTPTGHSADVPEPSCVKTLALDN